LFQNMREIWTVGKKRADRSCLPRVRAVFSGETSGTDARGNVLERMPEGEVISLEKMERFFSDKTKKA